MKNEASALESLEIHDRLIVFRMRGEHREQKRIRRVVQGIFFNGVLCRFIQRHWILDPDYIVLILI
jgi:hypothetical protein